MECPRKFATISIFRLSVITFILIGSMCVALGARAATAVIEKPHFFEIRKGESVSWLFGTRHSGIAFEEVEAHIGRPLRGARILLKEILSGRTAERQQLYRKDPAEAILTSPDFDFSKGEPLSIELQELLVSRWHFPLKLARVMKVDSCDVLKTYNSAIELHLGAEIQYFAELHHVPVAALDSAKLRSAADRADLATTRSKGRSTSDLAVRRALQQCSLEPEIRFNSPEFNAERESIDLGRYRAGRNFTDESAGETLRNLAWMRTLVPNMKQGGAFVAVGVDHLYGEKGLLNLLKRAGFDVVRLPSRDRW
jgi:hypothetical protein